MGTYLTTRLRLDQMLSFDEVLSTLLEGGFSVEALGFDNTGALAQLLEQYLRIENGLVGFGSSSDP